jgi:hypothetical protein
MIEISLYGVRARVDHGKWSSRLVMIQRMLDTLCDPDGPRGSDPDPDRTLAEAAVRRFGAVILTDRESPRDGAGVVY